MDFGAAVVMIVVAAAVFVCIFGLDCGAVVAVVFAWIFLARFGEIVVVVFVVVCIFSSDFGELAAAAAAAVVFVVVAVVFVVFVSLLFPGCEDVFFVVGLVCLVVVFLELVVAGFLHRDCL